MRKELTIFIPTTAGEDEDMAITTTRTPGVIVLTLPNGAKVGVDADVLNEAVQEAALFKRMYPEGDKDKPAEKPKEGQMEWVDE
jgi:hypothetical protein